MKQSPVNRVFWLCLITSSLVVFGFVMMNRGSPRTATISIGSPTVQILSNQSVEEAKVVIGHATQCDRALIFIHLAWSIDSALALKHVDKCISEYSKHSDLPYISFHAIDYTELLESHPISELPGWNELQASRRYALLGYGDWVYLENGKVIDAQPVFESGNYRASSGVGRIHDLVSSAR